jgi:glycosyltransferase involved in cell wall biosynthesis
LKDKKNKNNPLVTILMNCRNEENFILRAINSALSQSYKNIELIVWDDASDDSTPKIIKSFNDKRLRFFENKSHSGLGPSRCKAIGEVKGDLVAILDADDEMFQERIEKQVNEFKMNNNLALVGSWVKFRDINGETIKYKFFKKNPYNIFLKSEQIKNQMLTKNIFAHSSIMYKKENALKVGWYSKNLEYSQDYDLSLKLIKSYDSKILTELLTFITIRKESMTQSTKLKKTRVKELITILEKCKYEFKMNKKIAAINSREIALNKLKLDLMNNISLITKLFSIIKTILKFPSLLFRLRLF